MHTTRHDNPTSVLSRRSFLVMIGGASTGLLGMALAACSPTSTTPAATSAPTKPTEASQPAATSPGAAASTAAKPAATTGPAAAAAKPEDASPEVWLTRDIQQAGAWAIADAKRFWEEEGLTPRINWIVTATDLPNMLATGSIKLAAASGALGITSRAAGTPTWVIANHNRHAGNTGMMLGPNTTLSAPSDLVGKPIGMPTGTSVEVALRNMCRDTGLDYSKLQFVNAAPPDLVTALGKGDIAAMVCWEPWMTTAAKLGAKWYWRSTESYIPGDEGTKDWLRLTAYVITVEDYYRSNPNTLKAFLRGFKKAEDYLSNASNHVEAAKLLSEPMRIEEQEVAGMLKNIDFTMAIDQYLVDSIQTQIDLLSSLNRLPRPIQPAEAIQPDLLKETFPELVTWNKA